MARGFQGTGNRYVDGAIAFVVVTFVLIVGTIMIGQVCPIAYQNTANYPDAFKTEHMICNSYFQNASSFFMHILTKT